MPSYVGATTICPYGAQDDGECDESLFSVLLVRLFLLVLYGSPPLHVIFLHRHEKDYDIVLVRLDCFLFLQSLQESTH